MDQLPLEILELIYLHAESSNLGFVNKQFYSISKDTVVQTKYLLIRYRIWKIHNWKPQVIANSKWISVVQDDIFNENIAITICQLGLHDQVFLDILAEYAANRGIPKLLEWLIHNAPYPKKIGLPLVTINRALIQSAMFGHAKNVELLLKAGADPKFDSDAALCMASKYGHLKSVLMLLKTDTNLHTDEEYPLCWASRHGHLEIVKALVEAGADINARRGCALHWASEQGNEDIVRYLLERGADVHSNDDHALRWSTIHGHLHIVEILMSHGANIHAMDDYALRNAVKMNHIRIVKFLLEKGANPHAQNEEAIKWAIQHKDEQLLQLLQGHLKEP
jgi:hypothetical protein